MRTRGRPPEPDTAPPAVHVALSHDDLIRLAGFKIHARPAKGPVLWAKDGKTYEHEFALEFATRKQVISKPETVPPIPDEPSAPEAVLEDDGGKF